MYCICVSIKVKERFPTSVFLTLRFGLICLLQRVRSSPYWGRLPKIRVGSSPVRQMDDQAGPGLAAASFESWCRDTRRKKVKQAQRKIQPYGPSGAHWWLGHYRGPFGDSPGHRVQVSFTARNPFIFCVDQKVNMSNQLLMVTAERKSQTKSQHSLCYGFLLLIYLKAEMEWCD